MEAHANFGASLDEGLTLKTKGKKLKVLLINPPLVSKVERENFLTEPLGLGYLVSAVEDICEVSILDCFIHGYENLTKVGNEYRRGMDEKEIINQIKLFQPDIVGVTCNFTGFAKDSMRMAELAKQTIPNCYTVVGGAHATMDDKSVIDKKYVDCVVRGEGEETFRDLVLRLANGESLEDMAGVTLRLDEEIITNPDRTLIKDMDSIPPPNRSKMFMDLYMKYSHERYPYAIKKPIASLQTSRGCPYECTFCSTIQVWSRRWRWFSVKRVVDEIENMKNNYGVEEFAFYDDAFLIDRERIIELCDEIVRRKLNINFINPPGLNVVNMDEEIIIKMKKAGLYRVTLPIETGNAETQEFIKKPIDFEHARNIVDICNRNGIWTHANFIIGFPFETEEMIKKTLDYSISINLDHSFYYAAQPHSGSELYDVYEEHNMLEGIEEKRASFIDSQYDTAYFTAEEIQKKINNAKLKHFIIRSLSYLNPFYFYRNVWPKINTWRTFKYLMEIIFNVQKMRHMILNR